MVQYYQTLNAGGWSNEYTFAKIFYRECINDKTIQDFIIESNIFILFSLMVENITYCYQKCFFP